MSWTWIEGSIARRYGFAGAIALLAVGLGSILVAHDAEPLALLTYAFSGTLLVGVAHLHGRASRRELADLHELHELSAALSSISDLREQLQLILATLTRIDGAQFGLVATYCKDDNLLTVVASVGFRRSSIREFPKVTGGTGACGLACAERRRIIIQDVERDERVGPIRDLARAEGFRAVHTTPLLSASGESLGVISVHFTQPRRPSNREMRLADICARKAAVLVERSRAEELARQRDHRFRVVLEASAVPFTILAPVRNESGEIRDFRWTYVNAAAARQLGRSPQQLLGQCVEDVLPGIWREGGRLDVYASVVQEKVVREHEFHSRTDGLVGWFHVVASPLQGAVAIWFSDITERKRHEETLHEADRRKDEFLATLAHELRNPLAPIRQAAMIAQSDAASDAQKRWGYAVIERQVQHMSLLLEDLLDVSRITRGMLQLRMQRTDLHSIVSAAVETARPLIESRRHQLVVELPANVEFDGDPLRLAQVFANLLTNAAKYTYPEGIIRFVATHVQDELTICVEDNGIGISNEDLASIFQMFSQVRSAQEHAEGGLGIGLALTRGLVELHGGRIDARSAGHAKGTQFVVRLPVPVPETAASPKVRELREPRLVVSRRVLVADDNRDSAESLAILLRLEGHEVTLAHDGESAYRLFTEKKHDVALLDIGMPLLSGYDLARRLRADRDTAEVLLVAITGWGQATDKARAEAAGFDHHLTKPVDPEVVLGLLRPRATRAQSSR